MRISKRSRRISNVIRLGTQQLLSQRPSKRQKQYPITPNSDALFRRSATNRSASDLCTAAESSIALSRSAYWSPPFFMVVGSSSRSLRELKGRRNLNHSICRQAAWWTRWRAKPGCHLFRRIDRGLSPVALVVSHTERGSTIRIISARLATNKERKRYES